jgi:hypothetical protein
VSEYDWMTEDQKFCADMFAGVMRGYHHVSGTFKPCGRGIKVHVCDNGLATADFDKLSRLVIRAHDAMVRVALIPSGPRRLGFTLHRRFTRDGGIGERHDTIEAAIEMHRIKS